MKIVFFLMFCFLDPQTNNMECEALDTGMSGMDCINALIANEPMNGDGILSCEIDYAGTYQD